MRDCGRSHTGKSEGMWWKGTANEIYRAVIQSNGRVVIKTVCADCRRTSGALPTHLLALWGVRWSDVGDIKQNEFRTDYEPCSYDRCGSTPTEYHHFAPYNTFGADANNWPCLPLCREHHQQWHRTMDGYRWHRKGEAA